MKRSREGELVARGRRRGSFELLGGHVSGRSCDDDGRCGFEAHETRETEVGDVRLPLGALALDDDVVRLEVAVHHARGVSGGQRPAGLEEDVDDLTPGPHLDTEPRTQRRARHALHREVEAAVVLARVEDGDDVRVREAGEGTRFLEGAFGRARAVEHLQRHHAREERVLRRVDDAHRAPPDGLDHLVTPELCTRRKVLAVVERMTDTDQQRRTRCARIPRALPPRAVAPPKAAPA